MPVTYVIDQTRKLIRTECRGPLTVDEVLNHFDQLKDDPDCVGQLDVFLDVSEITSLPKSFELRMVSSKMVVVRNKVQFGKCAVLATGNAMYGMMRMFAFFAETEFQAIQVFRNVAEAEGWLGSDGKWC
jgi:hypothetical protein